MHVPAEKMRIEVRNFIDVASVYNAEIYPGKPLFQYILTPGKAGETKKYLFRLKEYMSLFFEEKCKNDDTIPPNWNAFEQIFGTTFNFVSKNHDDVDRAGHRKGCCGFYGTHDVKEFLLLLDDVFAFRTSLGAYQNFELVDQLPELDIRIEKDRILAFDINAADDETKCPFTLGFETLSLQGVCSSTASLSSEKHRCRVGGGW